MPTRFAETGAADAGAGGVEIETFTLAANGWVPNNPHLPVLLYRHVVAAGGDDIGAALEARFNRNGWPVQWRDTVLDYHHFHSTAHEALGVCRARAKLVIGGPGGRAIDVEAGDVLVLPAGTGHCLVSRDGPFEVVGAYPPGQQWDMRDMRGEALTDDERRAMLVLAFPHSDPVCGSDGPLTRRSH